MATYSNPGQPPKRAMLTISIDQADQTEIHIHAHTPSNREQVMDYDQFLQESESPDPRSGKVDLCYETAVLTEAFEILRGREHELWRRYPDYETLLDVLRPLAAEAQGATEEANRIR